MLKNDIQCHLAHTPLNLRQIQALCVIFQHELDGSSGHFIPIFAKISNKLPYKFTFSFQRCLHHFCFAHRTIIKINEDGFLRLSLLPQTHGQYSFYQNFCKFCFSFGLKHIKMDFQRVLSSG